MALDVPSREGKRTSRSFLRDPLLHFVAFGAAVVFAQNVWGGPSEAPGDARTIVVTEAQRRDIRAALRNTLERVPSEDEFARAIERHIEEEILVREARARGLEADDPVVRAHLARKMRFVLEAREAPTTPPEEALRELYETNREEYALEARLTVRQLFFAGDDAASRASVILAELEAGADPRALADRADPPPGGPVLRGRSPARLTSQYGARFVEGLDSVAEHTWVTRTSPLGVHVVRVERRRNARALTFDEVRNRLITRWQRENVGAARDEAMTSLRAQYSVVGWPE